MPLVYDRLTGNQTGLAPIALASHRPTLNTNMPEETMRSPITVAGVTLDVEQAGQGRPLLFLHPGEGLQSNRPWIEALAGDHHVIAPHHPGFGNSSLPDWFG